MIHILDLHFQGIPNTIAAFLVETAEGPVLVESGPHSTFAKLEVEVKACGYNISDIRHVLLTHIHLDHGGAAWALAELRATVYVHPFGARHLMDPTKLMNSARRIYRDKMDSLWGEMKRIPETKLRIVEHREKIRLGEVEFTAWHTPGHAVHHIAWQMEDVLFAGDIAGIKIGKGMVAPPCPPPDINIEDWQDSIALVKSLGLSAMYLTHFGKATDINSHLDELGNRLISWANWIRPYFEKNIAPDMITPKFEEYVRNELIQSGLDASGLEQYQSANPAWMSVAGLMRYWKKKATEAGF